jgi:hypothetical protein
LDLAATLAIGAISVGISERQQITDLIGRVLPQCRQEDRNFAVKVAAKCLSGLGLPQMHRHEVEIDEFPAPGNDQALQTFTQLQEIRAELEGNKADIHLLLYESLRGRLLEGRYYDEVEALMPPLAASEVIWRFGEALQKPATLLTPYQSEADIGVPKSAVLAAMKISYLHRRDDADWCEQLKNSTVLVAHFVEAKLFASIVDEIGDSDPINCTKYHELIERTPLEMEAISKEWASYCKEIDEKLSSITQI